MTSLLKYIKRSFFIRIKRALATILPGKSKKYNRYIIICHPRSGSTYLHTLLQAHPSVISYGYEFINQLNQNPVLSFSKLFKNYAPFVEAVGFKWFYDNIDDPTHTKINEDLKSDSTIKVIHLYRKDLLASYTSLLLAQHNNKWSEKRNEPNKKLYIEPADFKAYTFSLLEKRKSVEKIFAEHEILSISYEDLTSGKDETMALVFKFLKVRQKKVSSLLPRQGNYKLEDIIENYNELMKSKH